MYKDGLGVPQDYVTAHAWFNLAAAQGNDEAAAGRDEVAEQMTPQQLSSAQDLARSLWNRIYGDE